MGSSDPSTTARGFVRTPQRLAQALAEALPVPPGPAPTLLDPACGEGDLLVAWVEHLGRAGRALGAVHGIELDGERLACARRRLAAYGRPGRAARLRAGDALDPARRWPRGSWVLANPPWVSFSGRQAAARARPGVPPRDGWPSLHGAFLERIARHVGHERTGAALLVPASVAELPGYAAVRRAVARHAELAGPVRELGERAFPGVLGPALLVTLRPRTEAGGSGALASPWTSADPRARELLEALSGWPRLPERTFADPGVHTGNRAAALVRPLEDDGWPGLRRGRDLRAYDLGPPSARLRTDLVPGAGARFRIAALDRYRAFPVLVRQTANRIVAALHGEPTYFRNSLLAARAVEGLDAAVLTAFLNGPVATAWHRLRHRDARQRAFPQVKVGHLASLPFPLVRRADDPELHDELARRVRALRPGTRDFARDVASLERRTLAAYGLGAPEAARVREVAGL